MLEHMAIAVMVVIMLVMLLMMMSFRRAFRKAFTQYKWAREDTEFYRRAAIEYYKIVCQAQEKVQSQRGVLFLDGGEYELQ